MSSPQPLPGSTTPSAADDAAAHPSAPLSAKEKAVAQARARAAAAKAARASSSSGSVVAGGVMSRPSLALARAESSSRAGGGGGGGGAAAAAGGISASRRTSASIDDDRELFVDAASTPNASASQLDSQAAAATSAVGASFNEAEAREVLASPPRTSSSPDRFASPTQAPSGRRASQPRTPEAAASPSSSPTRRHAALSQAAHLHPLSTAPRDEDEGAGDGDGYANGASGGSSQAPASRFGSQRSRVQAVAHDGGGSGGGGVESPSLSQQPLSQQQQQQQQQQPRRTPGPRSSYYFGPPAPGSAFGTPPVGVIGRDKPREIVRVERDYTAGELCQFHPAFPLELEGRLAPATFTETINDVNEALIAAHDAGWACLDNTLAVLTLYLSPFVVPSKYKREMQRLRRMLDDVNRATFNPAGLNIRDPAESAFLFLEIEYF